MLLLQSKDMHVIKQIKFNNMHSVAVHVSIKGFF